ncbi:hypothetical protein HPB51_010750 [Rhipicephalus microplus]|uniref:Uncharacterized protein n=1 Tax=Rhipicephalus microplus TaxID=6941 RepID=A0A9J6DUY8_RHIMP|nr:hypothetical protein HPB51_010750 [Rhipicephalus microplus]
MRENAQNQDVTRLSCCQASSEHTRTHIKVTHVMWKAVKLCSPSGLFYRNTEKRITRSFAFECSLRPLFVLPSNIDSSELYYLVQSSTLVQPTPGQQPLAVVTRATSYFLLLSQLQKPKKATRKCRPRNFFTKSAAAVLSGHTPPPETEKKLLSLCIASAEEVEFTQRQEKGECTSQSGDSVLSHRVPLRTCQEQSFSMGNDADDVSLPEDFTRHAYEPLADTLVSGLGQPSAQNDLSEVMHAVTDDLEQHKSQLSSSELCQHIEELQSATETCLSSMDSALGSLVNCGTSSAYSESKSEFQHGLEGSFTVSSVKAQRFDQAASGYGQEKKIVDGLSGDTKVQ